MSMTKTFDQAVEYIHSFKNYEISAPETIPADAWRLARMQDLLSRLGNPQQAYPIIHIAGSKGKGSTAAMCTQILMEAGMRTGLYCSPHLVDFRERIQLDRQLIAPQSFVQLTQDVKPHAEQVPGLTWFEMLTALAFWHFERERIDVAVIEVGLGGRLDATNVVTPIVSVITHLMLDHTQLLGSTLSEIAAEKAAIIKPGLPVLTAPQAPEAMTVIEQVAAQNQSTLTRIINRPPDSDDTHNWYYQPTYIENYGLTLQHAGQSHSYLLSLCGRFQAENAALAIATVRQAAPTLKPINSAIIASALARTKWPGRFEKLSTSPLVIIDGAHNPQATAVLADELGWLAGRSDWTLIFGCMSDKDVEGMLALLLPLTSRAILTQANSPRALPVEKLLTLTQAISSNTPLVSLPTVQQALSNALENAAPETKICVCGSLSVAGDALVAWHNQSDVTQSKENNS